MKGGLVTLGDYSLSNILNREMTNGNVPTVNEIATSSIGGFVYLINFTRPIPELFSIYPGRTQNIISNSSRLILKIIQIGDRQRDVIVNGKEITTVQLFNSEIRTQNDIYAGSLDCFLEPICPKIIKSGTVSNDYRYRTLIINILSNLRTTRPRPRIEGLVRDTGFIFMELLENAYGISRLFSNYTHTGFPLETRDLSSQQKKILKNYLYQLIRLNLLGYTHCDTHLENAMYVDNYDYIENYRVYLIDFGKTKPISVQGDHYNINEVVTQDNYWSYKQLQRYVNNILTINTLQVWYDQQTSLYISQSRNNYITKLYDQGILRRLEFLYKGNHYRLPTEEDLIFKAHGIPLRQTGLNQNPRLNITWIPPTGCVFTSETINTTTGQNFKGTVKVSTDLTQNGYGIDVITLVNNAGRFIVHGYDENMVWEDVGLYLWVLGIRQGETNPHIFFIYVNSCFEFCSKHMVLMQINNITNIYAAGELFKRFNTFTFNLLSGTYMVIPFNRSVINQSMITSLNNDLIVFVKYKFNNPNYVIQMCDTCNNRFPQHQHIFTNDLCCQSVIYSKIQTKYFFDINRLFVNNGRLPIFITTSVTTGGGDLPQSDKLIKTNNNRNDDESLIKIKYITVNNLLLSDFDIQFYKKINSDRNGNLMKNLQIINEYAKICGANSYNDCLNTTELSNSDIKANIIFINPDLKEIINSVLIKNDNNDKDVIDSKYEYSKINNGVKPIIPSIISNQEVGVNSGGYLNKRKKHKKKSTKRNKRNKRNKTVNKKNKKNIT